MYMVGGPTLQAEVMIEYDDGVSCTGIDLGRHLHGRCSDAGGLLLLRQSAASILGICRESRPFCGTSCDHIYFSLLGARMTFVCVRPAR